MRAEPPPPPRRRDREQVRAAVAGAQGTRRRCPYLEQLLRERAGPFGMLVRFKADCHVDRRTHRFTGRNPHVPCLGDHASCALYRRAHDNEDHSITRYTD